MSAVIIDGRSVATKIQLELGEELEELKKMGIKPSLRVLLVGDDPASLVYVENKEKACVKVGIDSETVHLSSQATLNEILNQIERWNEDNSIHGILVQLPLPPGIEERKVTSFVSPLKDVDCFHPYNIGKLMLGDPIFLPCTPAGIQQLLLRSGILIEGKHVVIVGRSNIVGKPLANLLLQKAKGANATVTICHRATHNLPHYTRQADILIAACGSPELIRGEMLKEGVVVIDVGVNRVEDPRSPKGYRMVGDVHFESAKEKASHISPVPGGVGPMTIAMLLVNTVKAAKQMWRRGT